MRILLTGGSGDMGVLMARKLFEQGDRAVILDLVPPHVAVQDECDYIEGSILDRDLLKETMKDIDCVVHIAAWHGIHEHDGSKNAYDFHDVNVTGTFNVFQTAADADVKKVVLISSTSVDDRFGLYGHTKVLNEEMARAYAERHEMDILTLRPRAFIPPWNRKVYNNFVEWANWFWKGAVHVDDVCEATLKSIDFLKDNKPKEPAQILTIDGAYEYSKEDLENWDDQTFRRIYGDEAEKLAQSYDLDTARKPKVVGSPDAENVIGYKPNYSLKNLLEELQKYGETGPKFPLEEHTVPKQTVRKGKRPDGL